MDLSQPFDNGLVIILTSLGDLLKVNVALGYYDDPREVPNAGASHNRVLKRLTGEIATDGFVAIGRHLIGQLQNSTNFGAALTAVCAHEYGHILQYKYLVQQLEDMIDSHESELEVRVELHADFVSGYFGAYRRREDPAYPAVIQAITQFKRGDKPGDGEYIPVTHGSPDQRGDAVYAGFLLGQSGVQAPEKVALLGLEYVRGLKL
jgi:hypothetical protein